MRHICASDPEQRLSRTGPDTASAYAGSSAAAAEISDPSPPLINLQLTYLHNSTSIVSIDKQERRPLHNRRKKKKQLMKFREVNFFK